MQRNPIRSVRAPYFRIILSMFWILYVAFALCAVGTAWALFNNFKFTSDGFHCYSTIRNLAFFNGLWEGPMFEYMLGNHSYFTMLLIAPLIRLFPSPVVLAVVNVLTHFATGALLYFLTMILMDARQKYREMFSAIVASLYILSPKVLSGFFVGVFMFQPDYLTAPILILLFLGILSDRQNLTLISAGAIVLNKEEYIPLFPFFVICFLHLKWILKKEFINKSLIVKLLIVYFVCSGISLTSLFYFRSLNEINFAAREHFYFDLLFNGKTWLAVLRELKEQLSPILPIFILFFFVPRKVSIVLLFYIVSFILGRIWLNEFIYHEANAWRWPNAIVPPMVFCCLACFMKFFSYRISSARTFALSLTVLAVVFAVYGRKIYTVDTVGNMRDFLTNRMHSNFDRNEVGKIRSVIPISNHGGYVVTTHFLMGPFMDRSHMEIESMWPLPIKKQQEILRHADYILLPKSAVTAVKLQSDLNYRIQIETPNLICFRPCLSGQK